MHFSNATGCGEAFTIIGTLRSEALGTAIENLNLEVSKTRFGTSEIQFVGPTMLRISILRSGVVPSGPRSELENHILGTEMTSRSSKMTRK